MREQSTVLLVRLDTDRPWTSVVGQLRTQMAFLQMWMPIYLHPRISVNDVIAAAVKRH